LLGITGANLLVPFLIDYILSRMNHLEYTFALLLGSAGAALALYLIALPFRAVLREMVGAKDFMRFRRSLQRLKRFDELAELERWPDAVRELERAVVLDALSSRQLISSIREHHQNLLSRALQVAEHYSAKVESIAEVEQLFIERSELQILYLKANDAFRRIQNRREEAGKPLPNWSQGDYLKRIREVTLELAANKSALQHVLAKLFQEIQTPRRDEIIYH
jgi:hypothetical protein